MLPAAELLLSAVRTAYAPQDVRLADDGNDAHGVVPASVLPIQVPHCDAVVRAPCRLRAHARAPNAAVLRSASGSLTAAQNNVRFSTYPGEEASRDQVVQRRRRARLVHQEAISSKVDGSHLAAGELLTRARELVHARRNVVRAALAQQARVDACRKDGAASQVHAAAARARALHNNAESQRCAFLAWRSEPQRRRCSPRACQERADGVADAEDADHVGRGVINNRRGENAVPLKRSQRRAD
jgi:hypothetical protein